MNSKASKMLYPDNYTPPDDVVVDRTPRPAQVNRAKQLVKDALTVPRDFEWLMAAIEADQPCVFTTQEKIDLLNELHSKWIEKQPKKEPVLP